MLLYDYYEWRGRRGQITPRTQNEIIRVFLCQYSLPTVRTNLKQKSAKFDAGFTLFSGRKASSVVLSLKSISVLLSGKFLERRGYYVSGRAYVLSPRLLQNRTIEVSRWREIGRRRRRLLLLLLLTPQMFEQLRGAVSHVRPIHVAARWLPGRPAFSSAI